MHSLSDSLSSIVQRELTSWRNPQSRNGRYPQVWTLVKCEGAYGILLSLGALETLASGALTAVSYTFSCIDNRPYRFFGHWYECSKFSVAWAIANLKNNLREPIIIASTPESYLINLHRENLLVDPSRVIGEAPLEE